MCGQAIRARKNGFFLTGGSRAYEIVVVRACAFGIQLIFATLHYLKGSAGRLLQQVGIGQVVGVKHCASMILAEGALIQASARLQCQCCIAADVILVLAHLGQLLSGHIKVVDNVLDNDVAAVALLIQQLVVVAVQHLVVPRQVAKKLQL